MLVKRRVTKPGRCMRQDASSRLPIFLCVQTETQALQFLWVLNGIQFRDSSTCFFLCLHLTWAIKAKNWTPTAVKTILQITLPYRNSHCSQQVAATRCLIIFACVFSMVSIFQNPWLHLCFKKLQRRRPAPTSREMQSCL